MDEKNELFYNETSDLYALYDNISNLTNTTYVTPLYSPPVSKENGIRILHFTFLPKLCLKIDINSIRIFREASKNNP